MTKYLLVDGNNIAARAAHASWATNTLSTDDGVPTAALMFFINSLAKVIGEEHPTHVAVAWDGKSEFRHRLLPTYKANRKTAVPEPGKDYTAAFPLMREFLDAAGIFQQRLAEFEADDLVATWWWKIHQAEEIIILSGDKDLYQLLGPSPWAINTTARKPVGGGIYEKWTHERFVEKNGFEPHLWALVGALTGDTSDNIEGIKGVGPKRALKLLNDFDWNIAKAIQEKYPEHVELVRRNVRLMDLTADPIPDYGNHIRRFRPAPCDSPDGAVLDAFLTRYELAGIQASFRRNALWTQASAVGRPFRPRAAEGRTTP